jgi:hypothetical protein
MHLHRHGAHQHDAVLGCHLGDVFRNHLIGESDDDAKFSGGIDPPN